MNADVFEGYSFKDFLSKTFFTMAIGLTITTIVAWLISNTLFFSFFTFLNGWGPLLLGIIEIVLVIYFSANLYKLSKGQAYLCFFIYSILNGCTLSYIFLIYTDASIVMALGLTTILFLCMSIIGHTTNIDLTKFANIFRIALISLIVASIVNLLLSSSLMNWAISCLGMLIFLALVAFDTQKLNHLYSSSFQEPEMSEKLSIYGALELYLDFINIFLRVLQIFGRRKD